MKHIFLTWFGLLTILCASASAQNTFGSGSTGADGAFAPTQNMTIPLPDTGVFNYTTVTIPSGITITYIRNAKNTPVTILASGDVQLSGTIILNGQSGNDDGAQGLAGPGGNGGGAGGIIQSTGSPGDGPGGGGGGAPIPGACAAGGGGGYETAGGGTSRGTRGGSTYGSKTLLPLVGGSGGGGGCATTIDGLNGNGGGGGGGGGAILIASSTSITFPSSGTGIINARGGNGGTPRNPFGAGGGGGSGGAIRLVANIISGNAQLNVSGGSGGCFFFDCAGDGGFGFARTEAFNLTGLASSGNSPISSGLPNAITTVNTPTLAIASVAGVAAPANPVGSFQGAPDIVLPANQANPVTVVVNGANIPSGTSVTVTATSSLGTSTTASATLAGTTASTSGSASISLGSGLSVLTATTVIDLATTGDLKPLFINGEKVDKIEVAAQFGGGSAVTYITHSGRRIRGLR